MECKAATKKSEAAFYMQIWNELEDTRRGTRDGMAYVGCYMCVKKK